MSSSWFIVRGESRLGPFTHHGLMALASNGELAPTDRVWCEDIKAPIQAAGVAGLFRDVDPPALTAPIPAPIPAPIQVAATPAPSEAALHAPPPPAILRAPPRAVRGPFQPEAHAHALVPAFAPGRGLAVYPLGDGSSEEGDDDDYRGDEPIDGDAEDDEDAESAAPLIARRRRRVAKSHRRADNSKVLAFLGGLSLIAVIAIIAVMEQTSSRPNPVVQASQKVKKTSPPTPAPVGVPAPAANPTRQPPPPPPKPRFDSQPFLEELSKSTVKSVMESLPSVKKHYRLLWEGQLLTQLTNETKRLWGEEEVRAAATRICETWANETRAFINGEAEPDPDADKGPRPFPTDGNAEAVEPMPEEPVEGE